MSQESRTQALFRPGDHLQLLDVADEPALAALQGPARFEQRQRGVDLGTAGADQERKLALRDGKVDGDLAFLDTG